jgi:sigma-E factor negative regulatory protein RseB
MMSVLRRPGLLLSAAATITVPGMLAGIAVLGHDHAVPGIRAEAVSLGTDAPASSMPAEPPSLMSTVATGPAEVRDAAQVMKASGMSMSTADFGAAASMEQAVGMSLLGKAAAAGLDKSYQGVEVIAQSEVNGTVTVISSVWHRGGGPTVAQTSDPNVLAESEPYVAYDGNTRSPDGVFGVTKTLVGLIGRHYLAVYRGVGSVIGRPALIVELDRADGSLAARFWLDEKTLVPLRRDVYDSSARLVSEEAFIQVQFGSLAAPPAAAAPARQTWAGVPTPGKLLFQLDSGGWQLPATLPDGLSLYEAAQSGMGAGEVVDLGYSDGLSVISLFVQRGTLAPRMPGWQPVNLNGHLVYAAEHSITWAGHGFVYTVIADAPPRTVEDVVAALPQNTAPGFFTRIGRGLSRMAAIVNPFH